MIATSWKPRYLARYMFEQDEEWITADGRKTKIAEMDDQHLLHTALMLEGLSDEIQEECAPYSYMDHREWLNRQPLYQALKAEIRARMSARHEFDISHVRAAADFELLMEINLRRVELGSSLGEPTDEKIINTVQERRLDRRVLEGAPRQALLDEVARRCV